MTTVYQRPLVFPPLAAPEELAENPEELRRHFQRGVELYQKRRYEEALREFQTAVSIRPGEAEAHYGCGLALARLGPDRHEEALAAFDSALAKQWNLHKAHSARGIVLGFLGRNAEAMEAHKDSLKLRPNEPQGHADLGMTLAVLGRYKEALPSFDRAIALGLDAALEDLVRAARAAVLKKLLRGLASGGKHAWLSGKPKGSDPLIVLTPGPPLSDYIIEDRH